jgi:beta-lactam-binding protein with PASTA domain
MVKKGNFGKSDIKFLGLNVLLAAIVVAVILFFLIVWLKDYTQHGVEVEVEDVRGMVQAEAEPILTAQGLRLIVVDSTYSDEFPFGTIVEQDPKPNSHAKHGRAVYVTINATTKRKVVMPDLQDMSYRQAETTLKGMGLEVDTAYEYKPSEYKDLVLDVKSNGVSVRPGAKVSVGTRVQLVVGKGRGTEQTVVPSVAGMTLQEARSVLLNSGLTVGAVFYDTPEREGKAQYVYRQTPSAGEQLIEGETVALRLSEDIEKASRGNVSSSSQDDEWF